MKYLFSSVPLGLRMVWLFNRLIRGLTELPGALQTVVVVVLDARRVQSCAKVPRLTVRANTPDGGATTVVLSLNLHSKHAATFTVVRPSSAAFYSLVCDVEVAPNPVSCSWCLTL